MAAEAPCRSKGFGPELYVEEYAHGDGSPRVVGTGPLGLVVFGSTGDAGLRAWDCSLPEGHPGAWCASAVAFEEGWPGPLRVYWRHAGQFNDIEECWIVRCIDDDGSDEAQVVPVHEAPIDSTWAVAGEPVIVVALTGDPHRVWVETREVLPKHRRRFIAGTGALCCEGSRTEPLDLERTGEERAPRCRFCGERWNLVHYSRESSTDGPSRATMQDHGRPG